MHSIKLLAPQTHGRRRPMAREHPRRLRHIILWGTRMTVFNKNVLGNFVECLLHMLIISGECVSFTIFWIFETYLYAGLGLCGFHWCIFSLLIIFKSKKQLLHILSLSRIAGSTRSSSQLVLRPWFVCYLAGDQVSREQGDLESDLFLLSISKFII